MGAYDKQIWNYLMAKIGNKYGVAGLMGNLKAESDLKPNNLQNSYETSLGYTDKSYTAAVDSGRYTKSQFVHDSAGYGLAQWTYHTRKKALYEKWKSGGYDSIGSIDLALDYLWYELQNKYPGTLKVLKNAKSIRQASDQVLHSFENPAVQTESVEVARYNLGKTLYDELSGTSTETETDFVPRLTSGAISGTQYKAIKGNRYWYSGNPFYLSDKDNGMPNCTCYAWGRFWEISDKSGTGSNTPTLPLGDAGSWWTDPKKKSYKSGSTPKEGAVICWSANDGGWGHVAIVEVIDEDTGDITVSQSGYQDPKFFWTSTVKKSKGYSTSGYTFQGFIYNPHVTSGGGGGGSDPVPEDPPYYPVFTKTKKRKGYNFVLFNRQRRMRQ